MKRIFQVTGLAIFLVLAVIIAIPSTMNSDALRKTFTDKLSSVIGAEIVPNGPVDFSIFPDFGIVARDLSITAPDSGFAVSVDRAVAEISITSVLSGQLHVLGFEFEQPEITLFQDAGSKTETPEEPSGSNDIFETAAAILERLSIDKLVVRNAVVHKSVAGNFVELASEVNIQMAIPSADKQSSIAFSGKLDGKEVKLDATIASLRSLLDGGATAVSVTAATSPAPHPLLKQFDLTGAIQLGEDGSYKIVDGKFESLGQPMLIDASYRPGVRPFVNAEIIAKTLEFPEPEVYSTKPAADDIRTAQGDGLDLSPLAGIDGALQLQIGTIKIGNAEAGGVDFSLDLNNGLLEGILVAEHIAGGALSSRINADLLQQYPEFRSAIKVSSVPLEKLALLAGASIPARGYIDGELQFAFRGTDRETVKNTINIAGKVSLGNGEILLPELASLADHGNGAIQQINATATIRDIDSPVQLSGDLIWNGEAAQFTGKFSPSQFLAENSGPVSIKIKSPMFVAGYEGSLRMDGFANGTANMETGSLSRVLALFGQKSARRLGAFSSSGNIKIADGTYAIEHAMFSLDGMKVDGSAKVAVSDKTSISADLGFDDLDLAQFVAPGANSESRSREASNDSPIDLSLLGTIQANIQLKADRIGYGKVKAGPASATLSIQNGIARLEVPKTGFYGGTVQGSLVADGSKPEAGFDIDLAIANVDALPLFTDVADFSRLEGKLDTNISITGSGNTTSQVSSSLDGTAYISFRDGALRGIDVTKTINNLRSIALSGYQENTADRTEFTELSIPMVIKDGIASTEEIRLLGPLVRMDGSGNVDLAKKTIDMSLNPKLVGSLDGQGGEFDVSGLGIPVIIKGPLSNPKVYPDLAKLVSSPDVLLQNLSKLQAGIKSLGGRDLDASKILGERTNPENLGQAKGVTGLLNQFALGEHAASPDPKDKAEPGDIVGSIFKELARQSLTQENINPMPMTRIEVSEQIENPTGTNIPVPTLSPRKTAASQGEVGPANDEITAAAASQIVENIIPDEPKFSNKGSSDLLKGLLNSLANQ